ALKLGGCREERMIETLDSGVSEEFSSSPRLTHSEANNEFVFVGRLISLKGCDLAIRAVARARNAVLHVVGDGVERDRLEQLVAELGIKDRVIFHGWVPAGAPLLQVMRRGRAFVLPSLSEANGIVVQEAMSIGLPVIAVNWGGPALLIDENTGVLVDPVSEEHIISGVAEAMDRLSSSSNLAERLSQNCYAKAKAEGFDWSDLLGRWTEIYRTILAENSDVR
ncbi:glycosyltransferase, partial [Sphingopyxis soli]